MFVAGLDLGQAQDYSALGVLEVLSSPTGERTQFLRHLHRWELQTQYPTIVTELRDLLARPQLAGGCALVVDGTGVGRPVVDYMRKEGLRPIPVSITGGDTVSFEDGWWRVPKRDLVSALAIGFEGNTLRIADGLEYGPVLKKELGNFKAKISIGGHDTYEAWRENDKDDLVLAVALAVWWARRQQPFGAAVGGSRPLVGALPEMLGARYGPGPERRPLPILPPWRP